MKKKDYNEIAKYEKAISEKFGPEAIQNPKKNWNDIKEKKYLKELEKFYKIKKVNHRHSDKEGFVVREKPQQVQRPERVCPVCDEFSFRATDDLYMNRYECCEACYIQFVEDREERWFSGWRPNK